MLLTPKSASSPLVWYVTVKSETDWVPKTSTVCCSRSKASTSSLETSSHRTKSSVGKTSGASNSINWNVSISKQFESRYSNRRNITSSSRPIYDDGFVIGATSFSASSSELWNVTTKFSGLVLGASTVASFGDKLKIASDETGSHMNKSFGKSWISSGKTSIQISSEYSQPKLSKTV